MNLLSNAIKYTPINGKIRFEFTEIKSSGRTSCYRLIVSDNGYGMNKEYIKDIFDAFSREQDSRISKIQGTGLGLAITKNLVDLMGGSIKVESEKGKGSTFTLDIPFQNGESNIEIQSREDRIENVKEQGNVLEGKNVLVAEDNELNAEILVSILEMFNVTCDVCKNGKMVAEKFIESKYDIYDFILMDVQMPEMNGYEATRIIRKSGHPLALTIPIIAMTANAFTEDIQHALDAGMNAHIAKPINIEVLIDTLKKVLEASKK